MGGLNKCWKKTLWIQFGARGCLHSACCWSLFLWELHSGVLCRARREPAAGPEGVESSRVGNGRVVLLRYIENIERSIRYRYIVSYRIAGGNIEIFDISVSNSCIFLPNFPLFVNAFSPPFDSHSPGIGIRSFNEPSSHITLRREFKTCSLLHKILLNKWSSAASTNSDKGDWSAEQKPETETSTNDCFQPLAIVSGGNAWPCTRYVTQNRPLWRLKVKVKVHTLDIAPLRSESPPQKRSGMARVLKGFQFFSAHPHVHPKSEWAIPAFAFPAITGTHLPTPEGWKAE